MWEDFIKPLLFIAIAIVSFIAVVVGICNQFEVVGDSAMIEQLRNDVTRVDLKSNEDVMGQVTQWNQKISSYKKWNRIFPISILIPDEWDKIYFINVNTED